MFIKTGNLDSLTFEQERPFEFMNVYQAINDNSRYAFVAVLDPGPADRFDIAGQQIDCGHAARDPISF